MRKVFIYFLLLIFLISTSALAIDFGKKNKATDVKSTQGIEINETEAQNVSKAKSPEDKEAKQRLKNRKKVLRNITKIKSYENNKRLKQRDKEFLEHRLDLKKKKLEELSISTETKEIEQTENQDKETDKTTENDKKGEN